jgi:hypothetical protein
MKTFLFILISFVALTAIVSGLLLIDKPDGSILHLQLSVLSGTPFTNFLIPGIILASVVGGTNLMAVISNMQSHPRRYTWAMAGGLMTCGWIAVQILLINTFYWLQFVYIVTGLSTILIAYQLKGKWAV